MDIKETLSKIEHLPSARRCHLWEVFSAPRVAPVLRSLGGRSLRSVDLVNSFDLSKLEIQHALVSDVATQQPYFLMMSPPCTKLCKYMYCNWAKMDPNSKYEYLHDALRLIDVSSWLAELQHMCGRYYCIENPEGSQAWSRANAASQQVPLLLLYFPCFCLNFLAL